MTESLPRLHGLPSGALILYDGAGRTFALPYEMALSEGDLINLSTVHQAPGSRGGIMTGFDVRQVMQVDVGTQVAGFDNTLEFENPAQMMAWTRAFRAACYRAVRLRDTVTNTEYDGRVIKLSVPRAGVAERMCRAGLTFQCLDSHGWNPHVYSVAGSPAVCPNSALEPAYPYLTCTATGATVTISDGERTLTITTGAGHLLAVDSGRADGLITDNGGPAAFTGRYPLIEPGGGTITTTGATDVQIRYREPR